MMMNELAQAITTLGFPIVCCLGLGYYISTTTKLNREDNNKREERMFSQLERFGDSLDNFNKTLSNMDMRLANLEEKAYAKTHTTDK